MKKIVSILLILVIAFTFSSCKRGNSGASGELESELVLDTWADDVREGLNDMMLAYGKASKEYDDTTYAVFDFDNTCSIFDVEEQLAIYQLTHMAFAEDMDADKLSEVLSTGLGDMDEPRGTDYSTRDASYQDWIDDITDAYSELLSEYGEFSPEGFDDTKADEIKNNDSWKEFATKMRAMYDLVYDSESADVAYPWLLYWFTGFTEDEVYDLAAKSHEYYKDVETSYVTWKSPKKRKSKTGRVTCEWSSGISVPDNIRELMQVLNDNGIKVWICSASGIDVVRAAVDTFGLHDDVTGVMAMTNRLEAGKYVNEYDYSSGYAWMPDGDKWKKGSVATGAQTQGPGKVEAINNVCKKEYGHGPALGFMDSTGDFWFCTEYKTLKAVVCMNRANRKVTDGGGVIAELAMYQRDELGYDFAKADAAGDTLYMLQGRDENELRNLRNSNSTLLYGSDDEQLYRDYGEADNENELEYDYMVRNKMTTEEVVDTFSIEISTGDDNNTLGFKYGFLSQSEFTGYHSID